jgi:hypothetical protein
MNKRQEGSGPQERNPSILPLFLVLPTFLPEFSISKLIPDDYFFLMWRERPPLAI